MRYPDFIPVLENEKRKRELTGLITEIFVWMYFFVVLGRIIIFSNLLEFIEGLAYADSPSKWALNFIEWTKFDSRYFEFPWTWIFWLCAAGGLVGLLVGFTGKGFGAWITSISKVHVKKPEDSMKIKKYWSYAKLELFFLVAFTVITGWTVTNINISEIFEADGISGAGRLALQLSCGIPFFGYELGGFSLFNFFQYILNSFVYLNNFLFPNHFIELFKMECHPTNIEYYGHAIGKLIESVYLAFIATFFSIPIAFVLSFFAARNLTRHSRLSRFMYKLIRAYMNISRSIEPLIWAVLFSVWIGIGPFSGMLALMVHTISSLVKQYSEAAENADSGPIDALQSTGANRIATLWFGVVPQVVMPYLAFTLYRWDINVRMATIIGFVGGGGIGSLLIAEQMLAKWPEVGSIAFLIFLVVWFMDTISARIREAIQ